MPESLAPFVATAPAADAAAPALAGRRSGRLAGALRPLSCTLGAISRADGSARVCCGLTDVLAGVYGPLDIGARGTWDGVKVFVNFRDGDEDAEGVEGELRAAVEAIVCGAGLGRRGIAVGVRVICADGGVVATAVDAVCMALVDAGVLMTGLVVGVGIGVSKDGDGVVVDPEGVEEGECRGVVTFVLGVDGVIGVRVRGDVGGAGIFEEAARAAGDVAEGVRGFLRLAVGELPKTE